MNRLGGGRTDVPTSALGAQHEASSWSNTSPTGKVVLDRVMVRRSVSPGPSYVFGTEQTP